MVEFELAKGEVRDPGGVRVACEDNVVVDVIGGEVAEETVAVCGIAVPLVEVAMYCSVEAVCL